MTKRPPFKIKGGAWPVSTIFSYTNEVASHAFAGLGSLAGAYGGLIPAWITGAITYSTLAIGFLATLGIPAGVLIAHNLSCAIAKMILKRNGILDWRYEVNGDNETGPIEIIKKWFEKGKYVWGILGENGRAPIPQMQEMQEMPAMPEYNGSILDYIGSSASNVAGRVGNVAGHMGNIIIQKMTQPVFALSSISCTVGDLGMNLITGPFYGFAYLAKKMFGRRRNINAVIPVDGELGHNQNVNPQQPTIKNKNHPNKKYMSQLNDIQIDEGDYGTPYTPLEKYNLDINNLLLWVQSVNYCTTYNAGNERQNAWMDYDEEILEKMETEIESMYENCGLCQQRMVSSNIQYLQCGNCNQTFHNAPYRFTDNIPELNRGCGGIYAHVCKEQQEYNTPYGPQGLTYSNPNRKKDQCIYCTKELGLCDDSTSEKNYTLIDFKHKMDEQTLTTQIGILTDIKNRMANNYVNLESDPPNKLDHIVSDVRQLESTRKAGGSKKQKNKTKRRKNKNTRRRRQTRR